MNKLKNDLSHISMANLQGSASKGDFTNHSIWLKENLSYCGMGRVGCLCLRTRILTRGSLFTSDITNFFKWEASLLKFIFSNVSYNVK